MTFHMLIVNLTRKIGRVQLCLADYGICLRFGILAGVIRRLTRHIYGFLHGAFHLLIAFHCFGKQSNFVLERLIFLT